MGVRNERGGPSLWSVQIDTLSLSEKIDSQLINIAYIIILTQLYITLRHLCGVLYTTKIGNLIEKSQINIFFYLYSDTVPRLAKQTQAWAGAGGRVSNCLF